MTIGAVTDLHEVSATSNSITISWLPPVATWTESVEGTLVEAPGTSITDAAGDTYALNISNKILLNGVVDSRTGTATVELLYYHSHLLWQQNSKGTWYYTADAADSWHQATGPIVTHFGVLAQLVQLRGMLTTTQQKNLCNQIITEMPNLMP